MKPTNYEEYGKPPKSRAGFPIPKGNEKRPPYYWAKEKPYKTTVGGGKVTYDRPKGQKFPGGEPIFSQNKGMGREGSPSHDYRAYVKMNSPENKARRAAAIERRFLKKSKEK